MNNIHLTLALAVLVFGGLMASSSGQTLLQLENGFRHVYQLEPSDPPTSANPVNGQPATTKQWENGTPIGGWRTTRLSVGGSVVAGSPDLGTGVTTLRYPKFHPFLPGTTDPDLSKGLRLESSKIGRTLVLREASYLFGGAIPPPEFKPDGTPLTPLELSQGYYLPEPNNSLVGGEANETFYYSSHAEKVFATKAGQVTIDWEEKTASPDPGGGFSRKINSQTYVISSALIKPARTIYWTGAGFNGPLVTVPESRVDAVNVIYNTVFPERVAEPHEPVGFVQPGDEHAQAPLEDRTLWYDSTTNNIHAYNLEGRVFVEFLGTLRDDPEDPAAREHLGFEIVEVQQEVRPADIRVDIGEAVSPLNGQDDWVPQVVAGELDLNVGGGTPYLHRHHSNGDQVTLYAIRQASAIDVNGTERQNNLVLIYWMEEAGFGLFWPKQYAGYILEWPEAIDRYSLYARSPSEPEATGVALNSPDNPALVYQDDPGNQQATLAAGNVFYTTLTDTDPEGRALIRYTNGESIWFERVFSRINTTYDDYASLTPWDVGQRITPPTGSDSHVGYIWPTTGLEAYNPEAYQDPFVVGFEEAAEGAIIGVNALEDNDELEVWWYKKSTPSSSKISGTYWPSFVERYQLQWPATTTEIILASNRGTDDLPSLQATGKVYVQNNVALPGYNPNEEHALMLNGRAWALRDDLNLTTTSEPYVLVSYTEADDRPDMRVFEVLRERTGDPDPTKNFTFNYNVTAGPVLQSPMPLPILPLPIQDDGEVKNYELLAPVDPAANFDAVRDAARAHYQKFTFTDRKGTTWLYRGPHGGNVDVNPPTLTMRYFYKTQGNFYFPSLAVQPAIGTIVPYLRPLVTPGDPDDGYVGDVVEGDGLDIVFTPRWPSSAPLLSIGESLTLPKNGLPAVRGQTSAELIYQQSIAADMDVDQISGRLFDPSRAKSYALSVTTLDALPSSVNTSRYQGKTYFPNLPPHLSQRFFFDPAVGKDGSLVLLGEFKDEPVGEKYLQLNVLGSEDITAMQEICDDADERKTVWNTAINGLSTDMETFIEDPSKGGTYIVDPNLTVTVGPSALAEIVSDDTAVDSYALSASGGGQGYVVLAAGNGEAFTPEGEPVSLHIFKICAPLYRGELKVIESANPLDEKITLQHSGDFAGHPEEYDFEWRYAPPVDGEAPPLFTYTRALVVDDGEWTLFNTPTADYVKYREPDADLTDGDLVNLPNVDVVLRDAVDSAGIPHAVLRKQFESTLDTPLRALTSLTLGPLDGARVYLNGVNVVSWNVAGFTDNPTTEAPPVSSGPEFDPLPLLFEIPPITLHAGENVLTVELYTTADEGASTTLNARLEAVVETPDTSNWLALAIPAEQGKARHIIQGNSLLTLTDNHLIMRYRARDPDNAAYVAGAGWSKWCEPQLAEGWIKRALKGINPFNQRVTDLFNNAVNTDVSLVSQAGKRWEGDVALNLENIDDFGLIEIYETILRRGKSLSIEGVPPINYGGANDALLLAAGYLNDLYMIVGNDGFADAANPTIAFNTESAVNRSQYGDAATALFSFKGVLPTVLDEELALLRGHDDFLQPGTRTAPVYNRLFWNYTRGIDSGEAIYALNYNIKDLDTDGDVDAADAAELFPQGHGDAYGHYLTALTNYYGLLTNPNFSWTPRTEGVLVLGKVVQVDYLDERKFAAAAAAHARTASQIVDLTYREAFTASADADWDHLRDGRANPTTGQTRYWGVDEWASRAGQGAYFHWMTGNTLLPAVDPDPSHEGIQKIDRTTVPELAQIVAEAGAIQQSLDDADAQLNPLGLSNGALAFDISPTEIDAGKTHYEQIYERAVIALQNAVSAFENAGDSTEFLRRQDDSVALQRQVIDEQERVFNNQLIELYGTPYTDDIGPGKTYAQGYDGPDLVHPMYVEITEDLARGGFTPIEESTYTLYTVMDPTVIQNSDTALQTFGAANIHSASASAIIEGGAITGIEVNYPGLGYTNAPEITIVSGEGTPGFGATATAKINPEGEVVSITLENGGNGYNVNNPPGIVITPPPLDGAEPLPPGISQPVSYTLDAISGEFRKPTDWAGRRVSPGKMQTAVSDQLLARQDLFGALYDFDTLTGVMTAQIALYKSALTAQEKKIDRLKFNQVQQTAADTAITALEASVRFIEASQEIIELSIGIAKDATPAVNGWSNDATFLSRSIAKLFGASTWLAAEGSKEVFEILVAINNQVKESLDRAKEINLENYSWAHENTQLLADLRGSLYHFIDISGAVDATLRRYDQAQRNLDALQAKGDRLLQQRQVFRQRAAALIQGFRTRDFAFRAFRNEALEKYQTLFDLAAQYTFLAAHAYDYETGLLAPDGNSVATTFYEKIVRARALGVVTNGRPQFGGSETGDPGLSGVLAQLAGDWSVVRNRLGFNNPDHYRTTFSLRSEKYRLLNGTEGDQPWKEVLAASKMNNILEDADVRRYAMQADEGTGLPVPGLVIPFQTTIASGYNFFGKPLAGGDSKFSPTSFATKIRSSGIAFPGYIGMDSPSTTTGTLGGIGATTPNGPTTAFNDPNALSATPRIYLIPAGVDSLRTPPLGDMSGVRTWQVEDQAIPLPFNIGNSNFSTQQAWTSADSLTELPFVMRKHQEFRAVPDSSVFPNEPGFTNSRLIGRSAWNSRWKLVIPGTTLLNDPDEGLRIFCETVKDIQLHLETYSYSGN